MKKRFLAAAIATGLVSTMSVAQASDVKVKWFGFAQITAEQNMDGKSAGKPGGIGFGADRIRFGFKIKDGNVYGKLQADLNKASAGDKLTNTSGKTAYTEIVKDALVGYKFSKSLKVQAGVFKTPIGMDFNTSGKKLDITKRGMEKKLVLERTTGMMVSGRKIADGFGYDVFYGNPSARGKATAGGTVGVDHTTAVRLSYDMGKMMHMEYSFGTDGASDAGKKDYSVNDLSMRFKSGPSTFKFERIAGTNVSGVAGNDETVMFIHYGHKMGKTTEAIVRYYTGTESDAGAADATMTNIYVGANIFLGSSKTNGRLQLNYVLAGGDTGTYNGKSKGYTEDTILAQYQMSF